MARPCGTCNHVKRLEIERALESGESIRAVAGRFGIARSSLQRHTTGHPRMAIPQTSEPVHQEERPAQSPDTADLVPAVLSPLLAPEAPAPDSPDGLTAVSGQPEPEVPAQPAVAQERPAALECTGGRLGPCPICGSNRWRQLDGHLTCDVCHPLPSPGTFVYTGRAVGDRLGTATTRIGNLPSTQTRVPVALSTL
jgi:hypothetical protein